MGYTISHLKKGTIRHPSHALIIIYATNYGVGSFSLQLAPSNSMISFHRLPKDMWKFSVGAFWLHCIYSKHCNSIKVLIRTTDGQRSRSFSRFDWKRNQTTNDAAMATSPGSNQDGVLQTNFCPECRNSSRLLFSIRANSVCRKTNGGIWCQSNGHLQICKTFTKIALHGQWLWLRWESGHIRNQRSAVQAPPYWKFLQSESIRQLQRKDSWKNCQ